MKQNFYNRKEIYLQEIVYRGKQSTWHVFCMYVPGMNNRRKGPQINNLLDQEQAE